MTRTVKSAIEFPKLNLSIVETIFSSAGEVIETSHTNPIKENFHIKTFLFRGGKRVEFPNTDQEPAIVFAPGAIAPGPLIIGKKHFKTTILQDDTRDYCVQTLSNGYLESSITDVDTNGAMNISQGCLIYVVGTNYQINGIICSENELFAVENNAILIALNSCKVYMFRAILKGY